MLLVPITLIDESVNVTQFMDNEEPDEELEGESKASDVDFVIEGN